MRLAKMNRRIMALDDSHPAKRFLKAFSDCQADCVGCELGDRADPIDQEWTSSVDRRLWRFSRFAYTFLALDFALDEFIEGVPFLSSGTDIARDASTLRTMMIECADAARQGGNNEIVDLTSQVLRMLDRWDEYASVRDSARSDGVD
jgi:hypothetical protein